MAEFHGNGQPKVDPSATQLAVRYHLRGEARWETCRSAEDAVLAVRKAEAQIMAAKNGLKLADESAPAPVVRRAENGTLRAAADE